VDIIQISMSSYNRTRILSIFLVVLLLLSIASVGFTDTTVAQPSNPTDNLDSNELFNGTEDGQVVVWEPAFVPLRTNDTQAETQVPLPDPNAGGRLLLEELGDGNSFTSEDDGQKSESLITYFNEERNPVGVHNTGSVTISYDSSRIKNATSDISGENNVDFIAARLTGSGQGFPEDYADAVTLFGDIDAANANATFEEISSDVSLDGGTYSTDHNFDTPGEYVVYATVNNGSQNGFEINNDGNISSIDGDVALVGTDLVSIQKTSDTLTSSPRNPTVGDDLDFEIDTSNSYSDSQNMTHVVAVYDKDVFEGSKFDLVVNRSALGPNFELEPNSQIEHSIKDADGVANISDGIKINGVELSNGNISRSVGLGAIIDRLGEDLETETPQTDPIGDTVINASVTGVTNASPTTTVTVETRSDFKTGDYQYIVLSKPAGDASNISTTADTVSLNAPAGGNNPPTAAFSFSPKTPPTETTVRFNASGSTDPENNITSYAWDFVGDSEPERQTASPTTTFRFPSPGAYSVELTVTDNSTLSDNVTKTVTVTRSGVDNITIDSSNSSFTPSLIQAGTDNVNLQINVSLENTTLSSSDSGTLVVRSGNQQFPISYNGTNVTSGQLTVSKNFTRDAPSYSGNVTLGLFADTLTRDLAGGNEAVLFRNARESGQLRFASVSFTDALNRKTLTLSTNRTQMEQGEQIRFNVTNATGSPLNATVLYPGITPDEIKATGSDGNVTYTVNATGNLRAVALTSFNGTDYEDTAYAPGTTTFTVTEPTLGINETSLTFGNSLIGSTPTKQLNITNNGSVPIAVDSLFTSSSVPSVFKIDEADRGGSIPANSNRTINITFRPFERGQVTGTLVVNQNEVPLSGTGIEPTADISNDLPAEIVTTENNGKNATITVRNTGNTNLNATITKTPRGINSDTFTQQSDYVNVSAGNSGTFKVEYNPPSDQRGGFAIFRLENVTSTSAFETPRVPVLGRTKIYDVSSSRSSIDFGTISVEDPTTQVVRIENRGTTRTTYNTTTNETGNFTLTPASSGTFSLAPGDGRLLTVEANISEAGTPTENLTISNTSDATPYDDTPRVNVTLTATAQAPNFTVANSQPIDFGDTPTNSTSVKEVNISNDGQGPLTFELTNAFNSSEATNFSVVSSQGVTIPAGENRNITAAGSPSAKGSGPANLTVTQINDPDFNQQNISLTINGTQPTLTSATSGPVTFGTVGTEGSKTKQVDISASTGSVSIADISVSGSAFSTSTTAADLGTVDSSPSELIQVTFEPSTNTTATGALEIDTDGDGTADFTKALSGTGQYGRLQIDRSLLGAGAANGAEGNTTTGTVQVSNPVSNTSITIDSISISGSNFELNTSAGISQGATIRDQSRSLGIRFTPGSTTTGEQSATVTVKASTPDDNLQFTRTITAFGFGTGPNPVPSSDTISVGTIDAGESINRTVTIRNEGGESFSVNQFTPSSNSVESATILDSTTVYPAGGTRVEFTVNKSTAGSLDTSLTIPTSAPSDPRVKVTGRVIAPSLSTTPSSGSTLEFGSAPVGSATQKELQLNNTGNATLVIAEPSVSGSDSGSFRLLSGDQTLRIAPDSTQNISIGFAPSSTGGKSAELTVATRNDPTPQTVTIDLNGDGTQAGSASLNNTAVGFGSIPLNNTQTQTLKVTNPADTTTPVEVTSTSTTGSNAYNVTGFTSQILDPGQNTTFDVRVNTSTSLGVSRGSVTGTVTVSTNQSASAATSYLGATAVEPEFAVGVSSLDAGTTRLGTTSTTTLEVNNTGNAELNLTDLSISGDNASAFSIVEPANTTSNTTIAGDGSIPVTVEFDPSAASNAVSNAQGTTTPTTANLSITSSDTSTPTNISLTGQGATAAFSAPTNTTFAQGQAATNQLEIENELKATTALNITDLSIGGPDSSVYSAELNGSRATPYTLEPGDSVEINVSTTSTSPAREFGTLTVETNDTRQAITKIGLSDTRTTFGVEFGSVNVSYTNPESDFTEPTINVDAGFNDRNTTLTSVNANVTNVSTSEVPDYSLDYTYNDTVPNQSLGALNDSLNSQNVTSVQYLNATTTASEQNFSESTFQVEVSKTTLAREGILGDRNALRNNVTIYHENTSSSTGNYSAETTELLYETTQGYVYEVTTKSYSVFAVGVREPATDDPEDPPEDPPNNDDDDGGSGGGGTAKQVGQRSVTEDLLGGEATFDIPDGQTVSRVDLTIPGATGQATVTELTDLPSGTPEPANERLSTVDITAPNPTSGSATVRLSVRSSVLPDGASSADLGVEHYTNGEWNNLNPTVVSEDDNTIVLEAQTDSFSLFAVTYQPAQTDGDGDTGSEEPGTNETDAGSDQSEDGGGLLPVVLVIIIVIAAGVAYWYRQQK
jgi:PGF-pre-PGF domain-containing protein